VTEVNKIAQKENHRPQIILEENVVQIHTWTGDGSQAPFKSIPMIKTASLTLRDVRLAILVEQLFSGSYEAHGSGSPIYVGQAQALDTQSAAQAAIPKRVAARKHCRICNKQGHHMSNCPERYTKTTTKPCPSCGEMHWKVNCPSLNPTSPPTN